MKNRFLFILCLVLFYVNPASADTIRIAVASNALEAIKYLANEFSDRTGHKVMISSGSTGKLYAQIINGAPFDLFLAANSSEPIRLEKAGLSVKGSRRSYAIGRLALLSTENEFNNLVELKNLLDQLISRESNRFAIANPDTAPYGLAARQALQNYDLWKKVQPKLIKGENINQAFQYVASGNVQYGLVALSQIKKYKFPPSRYVVLPDSSYESIDQQAVILLRAKENLVAREFLSYISGDLAGKVLSEKFGYGKVSSSTLEKGG